MRRGRSALVAVLAATGLAAAACGGGTSFPTPVAVAPIVEPPHGAVVDALEWGTRDLALARQGLVATVQVVDSQGGGVSGLRVRIDGKATKACGAGCYRGRASGTPVIVAVGGRSWRFTIPATAPSAAATVQRLMRSYSKLETVQLRERLASTPTNALHTTFVFVAPDKLRYTIAGGSSAIVIGSRRWDKALGAASYTPSAQDAVNVMRLLWQSAYDAHLVAPSTITFFDPTVRAWFRVTIAPKANGALPRTVRMTGISHFMVDRYSNYDAPASIEPPTKRAR